jgi:hypothetical protein
VLWLHEAGVPQHARGILIDRPVGPISVGEEFRMHGTTLGLREKVSIEIDGAAVWGLPQPHPRDRIPLLRLPGRWAAFHRTYLPSKPASMPASGDALRERAFPAEFAGASTPGEAFRWEASSIVDRVLDCCLARDMKGALAQGVGLIGLGGGLTPSGDDFLGGLLFAAWALERLYGLAWLRRHEELEPWLKLARGRTHCVSYALLADHAHGSGAEPLHHFVYSFLSRKSMAEVVACARQLERLGGSTGSALIAGVLAGMMLAFPGHVPVDEARGRPIRTLESGR